VVPAVTEPVACATPIPRIPPNPSETPTFFPCPTLTETKPPNTAPFTVVTFVPGSKETPIPNKPTPNAAAFVIPAEAVVLGAMPIVSLKLIP